MQFFQDITDDKLWYFGNKAVKLKEDKVIVKVYEADKFIESVIIPTVHYPLNAELEVFNCRNTMKIIDKDILSIIDSVKYMVGRCYTYSESVCIALREKGFDAVQYVGWLFYGYGFPTHHSWVVLDGKHIIDLSDDDYLLNYNLQERKIDFHSMSKEQQYDVMIDFHKWQENTKMPNSQRCCHIGEAYPTKLYVGSKCGRYQGANIFNELTKRFPNHPCLVKGTDKQGLSPLQRKMRENGLF